jgi:caffeoyl-CoA O-methyltransferase
LQRTLELGVFTGISALATALALPEDGKVVALDVSEEYTNVGRPVWEEAGVAHKIDLRIKPAVETLDELLKEGQQGTFDFAFVDGTYTPPPQRIRLDRFQCA